VGDEYFLVAAEPIAPNALTPKCEPLNTDSQAASGILATGRGWRHEVGKEQSHSSSPSGGQGRPLSDAGGPRKNTGLAVAHARFLMARADW
jgi:hypothetical protein